MKHPFNCIDCGASCTVEWLGRNGQAIEHPLEGCLIGPNLGKPLVIPPETQALIDADKEKPQ